MTDTVTIETSPAINVVITASETGPSIITTETGVTVQPTDAAVIVITHTGPRGPAGDAVASVDKIAAQALGGNRVVKIAPAGEVDYASSASPGDGALVLGVTTGAAVMGASIEVQTGGEMVELSWTWTLGPVFLGLNGLLTQTAPTSGFIQQIGIALSATVLLIDVQQPLTLI